MRKKAQGEDAPLPNSPIGAGDYREALEAFPGLCRHQGASRRLQHRAPCQRVNVSDRHAQRTSGSPTACSGWRCAARLRRACPPPPSKARRYSRVAAFIPSCPNKLVTYPSAGYPGQGRSSNGYNQRVRAFGTFVSFFVAPPAILLFTKMRPHARLAPKRRRQ